LRKAGNLRKVSCFFAPKIEYGTLRHLLFSF
jgi:hypothetical protein